MSRCLKKAVQLVQLLHQATNLDFFELTFKFLRGMTGHTGILRFSAGMDVSFLSVVGWTLKTNHTQTHIHSQHDTHIERLSCLDMLAVISVTAHRGQQTQQLWYKNRFFQLYGSLTTLHYFLIMPPCVLWRGEKVGLNRHLIYLLVSLALWLKGGQQ